MESNKKAVDGKCFDDFKSPMDIVHDLLNPPKSDLANSALIGFSLYAGAVVLGSVFGELTAVFTGSWTPIVIFGISSLFFLETRIGNYIKDTAREVWEKANFDSRNAMGLIFNSKLRTILGIVSVLVFSLTILANPSLNIFLYQSLVLRGYLAALVLFLVFILGEAISGAVGVVLASRSIAEGLSKYLEPVNFDHFQVLKRVAWWGVLLSVYGSMVASVLLVGMSLAQWGTTPINIQTVPLILLSITSGVMVYLFLTPTLYIHRLLKTSKQKNLFQISTGLEKLYARFGGLMEPRNPGETEAEADLIGKILADVENARTVAASAPEWPWDLPMLHAFTASLLLPLIIYYLERLIEYGPLIKA